MSMNKPTLVEYWDMLNNHDWYHMMSDDSRVDRAGTINLSKLLDITKLGDEYKDLYTEFRTHHFTGKPWDSEQTPKPKRPKDV